MAGGANGHAAPAEHRGFEVPGTLFLALTFLVLFIILYAISWYELSSVPWRIR